MLRRVSTTYQHNYSALFEWNLKRWHGDDDMAAWMTATGLMGATGINVVSASLVVGGLGVTLPPPPKWVWACELTPGT